MNRRKAFELIKMGQDAEGRNLLKRAIDITHEMALELIKHCQSENIDCIVAPYEADAQLAYLNISGIADLVITEDSDLTLFGCKKVSFIPKNNLILRFTNVIIIISHFQMDHNYFIIDIIQDGYKWKWSFN